MNQESISSFQENTAGQLRALKLLAKFLVVGTEEKVLLQLFIKTKSLLHFVIKALATAHYLISGQKIFYYQPFFHSHHNELVCQCLVNRLGTDPYAGWCEGTGTLLPSYSIFCICCTLVIIQQSATINDVLNQSLDMT